MVAVGPTLIPPRSPYSGPASQRAKISLDRGTRIVGPWVENSTITSTPATIVPSAIFPARASCSARGTRSARGLGSRAIPDRPTAPSAGGAPADAPAPALGASTGWAPALEASTGGPSMGPDS